ncbi:MAG: PEP-CTERM sorting domain-containing protein [Phycisphaeraceae bacterium]|nr:PEP-CTERM sorting domain-containing protein [Phycisphaeraceae bacterium]
MTTRSLFRFTGGSLAVISLLLITSGTSWAVVLPETALPHRDVIQANSGLISMTAEAGGMWDHDTKIFNSRAYNVDAAGEGNVGLRVTFEGIDLTGLNLAWFPLDPSGDDWTLNRWEGGVQLGVTTANNLVPPFAQENVGMGPHMKASAGTIIYANPSANQGGDAWWSGNSSKPGSKWNPANRDGSGYDVRPDHGNVVNYAGKGQYSFEGAPPTHPYEGDIVFTGEYDGFASNHWYRKDAIDPHTEWTTGVQATDAQIHAVNTFDMVIEYTPIAIEGRDEYKRYKVEWWYRKHQSSAKLEGGYSWWAPDANDADGGWIQPGNESWLCGGLIADGTMTGVDEPGFDFSAVFPYAAAFGWWREDNPQQTVTIDRIVVDYLQYTLVPPKGDLNGDGVVTLSDITPFKLALVDWNAYVSQYPGVNHLYVADANGDGVMTLSDIPVFKQLLVASPDYSYGTAIPEPSTGILFFAGSLSLAKRRRK